MNQSLTDTIVSYLHEHPDGVTSLELASEFLKFKTPESTLAHLTITGILGKDRRCSCDPEGLWRAQAIPLVSQQQQSLLDIPWIAVYLVEPSDSSNRSIYHISIYRVLPAPELLFAAWLSDPDE